MRRNHSGTEITCQGVEKVPQLVSVLIEIRICDHASHVLAVEVVVGGVDVARAPVRVVVAVGARAEGTVLPQRRCCPVIVVMAGRYDMMMMKIETKCRR